MEVRYNVRESVCQDTFLKLLSLISYTIQNLHSFGLPLNLHLHLKIYMFNFCRVVSSIEKKISILIYKEVFQKSCLSIHFEIKVTCISIGLLSIIFHLIKSTLSLKSKDGRIVSEKFKFMQPSFNKIFLIFNSIIQLKSKKKKKIKIPKTYYSFLGETKQGLCCSPM